MATALAPATPYIALPPPRATALKAIAASDGGTQSSRRPDVDPEELREDELNRLRTEDAETHSAGAGADANGYQDTHEEDGDDIDSTGETPSFPGGDAAFVTQLLSQDEPDEEQPDPFGDASRAYERLHEERDTHFIDILDPVDVKI